MRLPKDDPELAEALSGSESSAYTVEGFRDEIKSLKRKVARLQNAIRLARTFSTEKRVQAVLDETKGI